MCGDPARARPQGAHVGELTSDGEQGHPQKDVHGAPQPEEGRVPQGHGRGRGQQAGQAAGSGRGRQGHSGQSWAQQLRGSEQRANVVRLVRGQDPAREGAVAGSRVGWRVTAWGSRTGRSRQPSGGRMGTPSDRGHGVRGSGGPKPAGGPQEQRFLEKDF